MVSHRVVCLHFHTLNFCRICVNGDRGFHRRNPAAFILGDTKKTKPKIRKPRRLADNISVSACLLSFGTRLRVCCFLRHFSPRGPSRPHFIRSFALAIVHYRRKTHIMYCFFCNSCFSQYDTRCVCEKLIDKIFSVSRETQYFSVFFCAPSVSFLVKFGLKPVFCFLSLCAACVCFL